MDTETKLIYGSWFRKKKKVIKIQSEEEARVQHECRKLYYVTVFHVDEPYCFLEINNTYFNVGFIDDLGRTYLRYEFEELQSGKLFLVAAQHWEFDGESDRKTESSLFRFAEDGTVHLRKANLSTPQKEVENLVSEGVDVSKNYEVYPDFGDYSKLIVKDR